MVSIKKINIKKQYKRCSFKTIETIQSYLENTYTLVIQQLSKRVKSGIAGHEMLYVYHASPEGATISFTTRIEDTLSTIDGTNKPLLKQAQLKIVGTYQHTIDSIIDELDKEINRNTPL